MRAILVLTTVATKSAASKIARILLKEKLAACVSITAAMESHYYWKNKKEKSKEHLLLIKTRKSLFPRLERKLSSVHPYDTPEILEIPLGRGSSGYLKWLEQNTVKA